MRKMTSQVMTLTLFFLSMIVFFYLPQLHATENIPRYMEPMHQQAQLS